MTKGQKLVIGMFSVIGAIVTLKLIVGTVTVSGANVCNEVIRNVISSPDGIRSLTVRHANCSNTGSESSVLMGHRDRPNEFSVLLSWEARTYQYGGMQFFPPPIAVQWYGSEEVHISAPAENIRYKRIEHRDGVRVHFDVLDHL